MIGIFGYWFVIENGFYFIYKCIEFFIIQDLFLKNIVYYFFYGFDDFFLDIFMMGFCWGVEMLIYVFLQYCFMNL